MVKKLSTNDIKKSGAYEDGAKPQGPGDICLWSPSEDLSGHQNGLSCVANCALRPTLSRMPSF